VDEVVLVIVEMGSDKMKRRQNTAPLLVIDRFTF